MYKELEQIIQSNNQRIKSIEATIDQKLCSLIDNKAFSITKKKEKLDFVSLFGKIRIVQKVSKRLKILTQKLKLC
jgi:hypothetical protein